MRNESYGRYLSEAYDVLNGDIDYEKWADFIEECFVKFCKRQVKHICEIACGTGSMSVVLEKRGYSLTCSDLSVDMLSLADKKARDTGCKNIVFTEQDMRSFSDSSKADCILCILDGVNCLVTPKEVKACFDCAYDVLDDGGIFIFDVNSKYKFEKIYSDNAYILEQDDVFCAWQNFYNEKSKICDFYLSFFLEEADGRYSRHDETVRERMYSVKSLEKYLKQSGFSECYVFGGCDFSAADEAKDERLYFAAVKSGENTAEG